jgi:hypothetical protein
MKPAARPGAGTSPGGGGGGCDGGRAGGGRGGDGVPGQGSVEAGQGRPALVEDEGTRPPPPSGPSMLMNPTFNS